MRHALTTVPGSLQAQADASGASLAETFLNCDLLALVDVSGSMGACDAPDGHSRYEAACSELATLQANHPGKIGVIAFSTTAQFCPGGKPSFLSGGTDLTEALEYAHIADGCGIRLVIISDGQPNNAETALRAARRYTGVIDTVYVGPEGGPGADFLKRLAAASGGKSVQATQTADLAQKIERLLLVG